MRKRGVSRRLLGLLGVGVLLVALHQIGALGPVERVVAVVTRPVQTLLSGAGSTVAGWFHVVGSASQLENDNRRLQSEVAALRQQLSQDTELKAQNAELRRQLNVGTVQPDRLVAAEVVGYQPDNFRQFLTIGRGSNDGLKAGMAVVQQGVLVGTLQDVRPRSAKVFLIVDPDFRVAAIDQDVESRPSGTVHGQIGNGLIMDKIAQTETVKPGDTIVTSGLGGDVEKGLIIGRVQSVNRADNGVFQTAQLASAIQVSRLEVVYVVVRPQ